MIAAHRSADEVHHGADAWHALKVMVNHKPPIADEVYSVAMTVVILRDAALSEPFLGGSTKSPLGCWRVPGPWCIHPRHWCHA
jgi:hypothetical protein